MGYNSVVSGYLKSIGILRIDGLSTGPPDFRTSQLHPEKSMRTP